jgi:uncharacterized integral membrane protein
MSSLPTGIIVLVCVFGGALLGMFLRTVLPNIIWSRRPRTS